MKETDEIKKKILQIAAVTDRGQRLNKLIAPVYQDKLIEMDDLFELDTSIKCGRWSFRKAESIFENFTCSKSISECPFRRI